MPLEYAIALSIALVALGIYFSQDGGGWFFAAMAVAALLILTSK